MFERIFAAEVPAALLTIMVAGGNAAASTAKAEGELTTAQVVLSFNAGDPAAVAAAEAHGAALVTGVTAQTKKALAGVVSAGFIEGIPPRKLGKLIEPMVGLTARDAAAVAAADVSVAAKAKLADKFLKRRGVTIARTESIRAANEGQRLLWKQAVADGLLTGQELREWIVTPDDRLCEICEPMAGQVVGLDDLFVTGDGGQVSGPPAHPDCRCATGLTDQQEADVDRTDADVAA